MNKIKQFVLIAILVLVATNSVQGQLLWKVSKKGEPTSYLFGTHHLTPQSFLKEKPKVIEALNNADVIIGEVDMKEMQDPIKMQYYMGAMQLPSDSTLQNLLTAEEYSKVLEILKEQQPMLPAQMINSMRPTALSTLLSLAYSIRATSKLFPGANIGEGLDVYFQKEAESKNKKVLGLETLRFQTDVLLKSKNFQQSKAELIQFIDCAKVVNMDELILKMTQSYIQEDLEALLALSEDQELCPGIRIDKKDLDILINNRNKAWISKLSKELLPNHSNFIAVGALHLPGDKGVIEGLRKSGYTVTPVQ